MTKASQKLPILTSLEFNLKGIEGDLSQLDRQYFNLLSRLKNLEVLSSSMSARRGSSRVGVESKASFKKIYLPKLKRFHSKWDIHSEWTSMDGSGDCGWEGFFNLLLSPNLTDIEICNINYHMTSDKFLQLITSFSTLSSIKSFSFEFLSSRITEEYFMIFAYGISKMPQLDKVVFKVIKNPDISIESIQNFVLIVFKQNNLKEIDLYIRGVTFSQLVLNEFKQSLTYVGNIQFVCMKQSIHIFKKA